MDKHIAIIPLRKESKGIPGKNKKKLLGRPLYSWVLNEALLSNLNKVYVYTDDETIISTLKNEYKADPKIGIISRNKEDATDTASTEQAMIAFSEKIDHQYETITLLQATSPLTTSENINEALLKIESEECDSVISLVREKRFIWDDKGKSINYDYSNRPRRQDFDGFLAENGAIYTTTKEQFHNSGIRIGGRIDSVEMPADTYVEIDEPEDFLVIEELMKRRLARHKGTTTKIKALILDVDGVFTDGKVANDKDGELFKLFNMRDGMGLEIVRESGIEVIVMTSETSDIVKSRAEKLQLEHTYLGIKDKFYHLERILESLNLRRSEVMYMGDDINDLANILSCGWGVSPNDAVPELLINCDIRLNAKGGEMAIREAVNFILNYNKRRQ